MAPAETPSASVAFTMDIYNHIIEGMQEDAMALLDEVLPSGKNRAENTINANSLKIWVIIPEFSLMPL